ncbi:MAG: pyruvate kinase [Alphaproteobacteria bacterium]|jgi:pyruvate kinase|nr:pyruvate kinase [Alphaproteobacteria bacterium]
MFETNKNAFRKTKILNSIGPATESAEMMEKMIKAGSSAFRFNFSHETVTHLDRLKTLREVSKKLGVYVTAVADIQGPKHRVGVFKDDKAKLEIGQKFTVDLDETPGDSTRVCLPHPEVIEALEVGSRILVDDGKVQLKVTKKGADFAETEVLSGEWIKNKKGFNIPDVRIKSSCLTKKDREDIEIINSADFDYLAFSFVQTAEDCRECRELVRDDIKIIAKMEKPQAMENLVEITKEVDALMVARGDLAVEVGAENVPLCQKEMIRVGRDLAKPVIVATHMMESMIDNPFPTRAEVTDVANAVFEGADCVMTSAETTIGDYPIETVEMMDSVIRKVEASEDYKRNLNAVILEGLEHNTVSDVMAHSAKQISNELSASAIVTATVSGTTAIRIAKNKPEAPILAVSLEPRTLGRLGICAGVRGVVTSEENNSELGMDNFARELAKKEVNAETGDHIVVSMGKKTPEAKSVMEEGNTNIVTVVRV